MQMMMVMVMRLLLCCFWCCLCCCYWWYSCCCSIVGAFPSRAPPVRLQEQSVAAPLFMSRSFSDIKRSFWAIAVEALAITVGALAIAVGVLPMCYAMAMLKRKTPIFSSPRQHKEARPLHVISSLTILNLFYFLVSYYPLNRKRSSLLCAYRLRSRYGACIVFVPYCTTRAKFLKRRIHTDKNNRAQEAYDISKKQKK